MFYRCKDCGGNAVYDPKKKKMVCESCGNEETQEKIPQEKLHICNNCGAEIESKKTDLALKCPFLKIFVRLQVWNPFREDMFHFGCMIWRPMCILKEKEEKSERGQKETMIVRRRAYIVL